MSRLVDKCITVIGSEKDLVVIGSRQIVDDVVVPFVMVLLIFALKVASFQRGRVAARCCCTRFHCC
jgi:hypothetical protein